MVLGLIEAFYGRAWTWPQRASVVTTLAAHGYQMHLYAPRADETLRSNWRQPLPAEWSLNVQAHRSICSAQAVGFGLGVSPEGFDPDALADWRDFKARIAELNHFKPDALVLLFDDPADRKPLSPETQARLVDCAGAATDAAQLYVCPTWYSNDPVLAQIYGASPPGYLRRLGGAIDSSVNLFWAGEQICATGFAPQELERVADEIGRLPTLWDNYPVNDGPQMFGRLHLRAPQRRSPEVLNNRINAHFINPALQPTLTQIPAVALNAVYQSVASGSSFVGEDQRFLNAAQCCTSDRLARQLLQDLSLLQDVGLTHLGAMKSELVQRYRAFDEPAAQEVLLWLNGYWEQHELQVDTQPDA